MIKHNLLYWLFLILVTEAQGQTTIRNPFQPIDLSQCVTFTRRVAELHLKAVLLGELTREAIIFHPVIGIKKVTVGTSLPVIHSQITAINLSKVEIKALPPCLPTHITIGFRGGS